MGVSIILRSIDLTEKYVRLKLFDVEVNIILRFDRFWWTRGGRVKIFFKQDRIVIYNEINRSI